MGGRNKPMSPRWEELRKEFGNKCEICAETEGLEFAHRFPARDGRGRGSRKRFFAIKQDPRNFRLLCRLCHCQYDTDQEVPF